ncbi:MAG TPA: PH domain-containing protein [Anaerolineae bacterium]|nr:PH domain-containing protein [Anaerolineae bacterium]
MNTYPKVFTPDPKYVSKCRWIAHITALLVLLCGALTGALITLDEAVGFEAVTIAFLITLGCNLLWWVPTMLVIVPYYRSLRYEIHADEIIVRQGILTKSVKHVPYRTVTNLTVKQGPFDRWFGLGSLDIQTAGLSTSSGEPEQKLVGLPNAQEVYELVVAALGRFRNAMPPTMGEEVDAASPANYDALLAEVRAIRRLMEK